MGSLRHRLLRLEHDAGARELSAPVAPLTDKEANERIHFWLSQDRATLSELDQRRQDVMRQVLDRAQKRMDAAQ